MQKGEFALGEDRRHGHAGAELDAARRGGDVRKDRIGRAHDGSDGRVRLVDRAHQQRPAAEKMRVAIARQRAGGLGEACEGFHVDAHARPPGPDDAAMADRIAAKPAS
jgi:hypothetical protein